LKFFLKSGNFFVSLLFIECSLGDKLSSEVLNNLSIVSLYSICFFTHKSSPNTV
jgi:hypothetical protein